jgi:hypothetical protein
MANFTVRYTKKFTGGTLKGLTFEEVEVHTAPKSQESSAKWLEKAAAEGREFGGPGFGSPYTVSNVRTEIER